MFSKTPSSATRTEDLASAGQRLYGAGWATVLACALQITDDELRKLLTGEAKISTAVSKCLDGLLVRRCAQDGMEQFEQLLAERDIACSDVAIADGADIIQCRAIRLIARRLRSKGFRVQIIERDVVLEQHDANEN